MSIILRAATAADQPTIMRLVRAARLNPMRLHWVNFVVAEDLLTHGVVGVGQLRPHGHDLELASLVVMEGLRGRGIGTALVRTLISRASGPLYLMCEGRLAAYYRRFGFTELTQATAVPPGLRPAYLTGRLLGPLMTRLHDTPVRLAVMAHPGAAPFG